VGCSKTKINTIPCGKGESEKRNVKNEKIEELKGGLGYEHTWTGALLAPAKGAGGAAAGVSNFLPPHPASPAAAAAPTVAPAMTPALLPFPEVMATMGGVQLVPLACVLRESKKRSAWCTIGVGKREKGKRKTKERGLS
jgi:hypothetical protein